MLHQAKSVHSAAGLRVLRLPLRAKLIIATCAVITLALLAAGGLWWTRSSAAPVQVAEAPTALVTEPPPTVSMTPTMAEAAGIQLIAAETRVLQDERRVPARIGYNETQRLEVKLPVEGVVLQVLAKPGDAVKKGDRLAVLSSVAVGLARDEVVQSEADAAIAKRERDWAGQIAGNLELLQARLKADTPLDELEREFKDKPLGDHRERVLSAYSRLLLAEGTYRSSESLNGALPGIMVRQRKSDKEVAGANFLGVCEQSLFDALQRRDQAQSALEHAERLVAVNRQKLRLQLGPFAELSATPADATICEVILRSNIDGFVEERLVTEGVHFSGAQNLFVLANVDTLWVSAQIYEREWADFDPQSVSQVQIECPAVPGRRIAATPLFVSVVASPQSRAVPLVAEFDNADRRLKPGMFAWVLLPFGAPRTTLVIPESAVARHESRPFVFVAERAGTYRKTDVTLGLVSGVQVEVLDGLQAGEQVVSHGVFYLKSQWLLQGQDDD